MASEHAARINALLGKLERQSLQIENATVVASGLALERDLRQLLSLNPNAAIDQLHAILELRDTVTQAAQQRAAPLHSANVLPELIGDDAEAADREESQRPHVKPARNDPCWCGSGEKYKRCHYPN